MTPSTPLQKLTRLAQIERETSNLGSKDVRRVSLMLEKRAILDSIGKPPPELANNAEPADWAFSMADTFPGITQEEVFPWLEAFASAVYDKGRENGTREALHHINAGTQGIIDAMRVIREGVRNGHIRAQSVSMDGGAVGLEEFITLTLKAAGLT